MKNTCPVGENGAGKSRWCLLRCAEGRSQHALGRRRGPLANPNAARKLGVGMVFQHFSLFDAMTVEENISLYISPELTKGNRSGRIREISAQQGLPLDPTTCIRCRSASASGLR